MTTRERIHSRRIGIIGMARSGVAAALLAKEMGGIPFVSDAANADNLNEPIKRLGSGGIEFEVGGHSDRLLESDYLILSPGVPPKIEILNKAEDKGIPIFSEIEFASWVCRSKIIAVTGSNGKTTTTTLIGEICKASGLDAYICGNVGRPFSEVAAIVSDEGVAVVEVSTFQLESIEEFHPDVALILNLSPDHLDRHGTFEKYKSLKYRIAENQTSENFLILNAEDKNLRSDRIETKAQTIWFSSGASPEASAFVENGMVKLQYGGAIENVINAGDIRIPGPHNLQNALAACAAVSKIGVGVEAMVKALKEFPGVEHRLERLAPVAGVNFINDSKATNVDSVCYALRSVDTPVYLIAGGRDKGASYKPIIEFGRGKIRNIVAIGEAKEKIFSDLGKAFPVSTAASLEEAVHVSFEMAHPGETVLLSPACASFDMFRNFEQRGRAFKEAVAELKSGKNNGAKVES